MRAALAKRRPDLVLPKAAWRKPWVIHCTAWGDGAEAVLRYLARYLFRVAITEGRIVGLDDDGVTIRHKHRASGRWHTTRLSGHEFMRRFLQHVLPKGLHKVRYSGSGITPGAIMLRAPVNSWRSIGRKPQDQSREPPIPLLRGESVPQHRRPRSRAAARAARPATSSMCASSTPNRYVDHDPME